MACMDDRHASSCPTTFLFYLFTHTLSLSDHCTADHSILGSRERNQPPTALERLTLFGLGERLGLASTQSPGPLLAPSRLALPSRSPVSTARIDRYIQSNPDPPSLSYPLSLPHSVLHSTTHTPHTMAATTATAPGPSARQSYHGDRHHPYQRPNKYWSDGNNAAAAAASHHSINGVATTGNERVPPSPPRSRRDASETPSIGLGVAFGQSGGGKWWDEELVRLPRIF